MKDEEEADRQAKAPTENGFKEFVSRVLKADKSEVDALVKKRHKRRKPRRLASDSAEYLAGGQDG